MDLLLDHTFHLHSWINGKLANYAKPSANKQTYVTRHSEFQDIYWVCYGRYDIDYIKSMKKINTWKNNTIHAIQQSANIRTWRMHNINERIMPNLNVWSTNLLPDIGCVT